VPLSVSPTINEDLMTTLARTRLHLSLAALLVVGSACSDNEAPPAEDHTPRSYNLLVDDVAVTAPYTFTVGQTVRVRIKFFNAAQEDLDDVESSHFGGLTFDPASLATAVRLADHHYQFDVTAGPVGSGTLQVSFGHNEAADEHTFDPVAVTVVGSGGPAPLSRPLP
jgi:hypothetical protein